MTPDETILEPLGGEDNLRMMCGAIRFRYGKGRVSFWVGEHIVRLRKRGDYSTLQVQERKTRFTLCECTTLLPNVIRDRFVYYTGYSLSF